jgi:PAS domain S-box-containing protein
MLVFPSLLMTADMVILDANKAGCKLFGYSKTEFKGMNMLLLLHEEECGEASRDFYRLIDGDLQQYQITRKCLSRDKRPL